MRETSFIQQNELKWRSFESVLQEESPDPEKLNELFIQVTDDLSYARTFYPNRSVRVYLNGLAQRVFFKIYKSKKSRRSRMIGFWSNDLPLLLYQSRKDLLVSFLVFTLAMAIGMLSCFADPDFLQVILGDAYVEMTKENIASGDPMAVYKHHGAFNMFLGITLNNLIVAFQTFLLGVFYAIGTIGSLLYNGIMLGAFQYFFIDQGLFRESFLAVWLHGAFEISSIVIAGAAGITMGRGLVFPGTYSRLRSFQLAARRGLSIMIGVVPLFIVAGFVESFLTRYTDAPDLLRGFFIFTCLGFVLFYFVFYPRLYIKKRGLQGMETPALTPEISREIDYKSVKTAGDLFTDTFIFYKKHLKPLLWSAFIGSAVFTLGAFGLAEVKSTELFIFKGGMFGTFTAIPEFFINPNHPWLFPLTTLAITLVVYTTQRMIAASSPFSTEKSKKHDRKRQMLIDFVKVVAVVAIFNVLVLTMAWYTVFLMVIVTPFLFLWSQGMLVEGHGPVQGLASSLKLTGGNFGPMTGLFLSLLLCGTLFFLVLDTGILYLLLNYISMNFFMTLEQGELLSAILMAFISFFVLLLIIGLLATGSGLQYFSNLEVSEAHFLKERIEKIETRQRIRGIDREA